MLSECLIDEEQYVNAVNSKGECYSAEELFMALIFQQQKMISQLIAKLYTQNKKLSSTRYPLIN
jgi:hypothetical protein